MTAEQQKAESLFTPIKFSENDIWRVVPPTVEQVATALREARREALEEAAKIASKGLVDADNTCTCRECRTRREIAAAIRAAMEDEPK